MKKTIFILAIATLMTGTIISGCQSSSEKIADAKDKVADAKDKVTDANQELTMAISDSVKLFKKESEEKITLYDKSLDEFKILIANEKQENKAFYEKKLFQLQQTNKDLKKKLEDYKEDEKINWETFKAEFSHDMDELGFAIKDLTVKNVK